MNLFNYDKTNKKSILDYSKNLEGHTFSEVLDWYNEYYKNIDVSKMVSKKEFKGKGALGTFLEKYYFGYNPNGNQEADFKEAHVELKQTCVDEKKSGLVAGERLSITNISYKDEVEDDFYKSHVWEKIENILLVQYLRDKTIDKIDNKILFSNLFTPDENDMKIIINDYNYIIDKIKKGLAHEISEGDTMYLGACTKGSKEEKMWVNQFYEPFLPAKKRNFCLKKPYMNYVLHHYILCDDEPTEDIVTKTDEVVTLDFEDIILNKINIWKGKTDRQLCEFFGREYNNNKAQWIELAYRMLGIRSNRASEFVKANVKVKSIRVEDDGSIIESMPLPTIKFKEIVNQEWEESDLYDMLCNTKYLFIVFKKCGNEYKLQGAKFWNMPMKDIDYCARDCWETTKNTVLTGVKLVVKANNTVSNNLPNKNDNYAMHVRPHTQKSAYKLNNGYVKGDIAKDGDQLPNGEWITRQSFWLNNDYIKMQISEIVDGK